MICLFIPEEIQVSGAIVVLNRNDAIVSGNLALGCYETYNVELFETLVKPGMNVLDVGANIGLYSAVAARRVGPTGRVIAVEPDPTNCGFLRRTRDRNDFANLTIVEKAAGASSGPAVLHLCRTNKADHRTYGGDNSRQTIGIDMATLDSIVESETLPSVDVIKIDTQGFELFVAQGMTALLSGNPRVRILMEFWPWGISRAGGSPRDLLDFFTARGFEVSIIDDSRRQVARADSFDELLTLTLERQHANLYLQQPESRSSVI